MKFKFEKLIIWKSALELGEQINSITDKYDDFI